MLTVSAIRQAHEGAEFGRGLDRSVVRGFVARSTVGKRFNAVGDSGGAANGHYMAELCNEGEAADGSTWTSTVLDVELVVA